MIPNYQYFLQVIHSIVYMLVIIFVVYNFYKYRKLKRVEWLQTLYCKFHDNIEFKNIRAILNYKDSIHKIEYENLKSAIQNIVNKTNDLSEIEANILEKFIDYLNYFKFIASLKGLHQITDVEINFLFYHELNTINQLEIDKYLDAYGFISVLDLIIK